MPSAARQLNACTRAWVPAGIQALRALLKGVLKGWLALLSYLALELVAYGRDWHRDHRGANSGLAVFLQWLYESRGAQAYKLGKHAVLAAQAFQAKAARAPETGVKGY